MDFIDTIGVGAIVLTGLATLVTLVAPVLVMAKLRSHFRLLGTPHALPGTNLSPVRQKMKIPAMGCSVVFLIGVACFTGLMVATAGGAVSPSLLDRPATFVCDGTLEHTAQDYSYKPGQRGVARQLYCVDSAGNREDIMMKALGAATVYYSAWALFLYASIALVLWLLLRRKEGAPAPAFDPVSAAFGSMRAPAQSLPDHWRVAAGQGGGGASALGESNAVADSPRPMDVNDLVSLLQGGVGAKDVVTRLVSSQVKVQVNGAPVDTGGAPTAAAETVEARLAKLEALRQQRIISEEEYLAKRSEILSTI